MKTSDEKIRELKEQSRNCALCGHRSLFDACSINLVSVTESGQINQPYQSKDGLSGMNAMLPMCAYHMVLSQEGLIAITTQNRLISVKELNALERLSDKELSVRSKLTRSPELKRLSIIAKAILNARKFQSEMSKELKKQEKSK